MSRSHLQKEMGFVNGPYIYELNRDGQILRGTAVKLAVSIGRSASWVRTLGRNGRPSQEGWTVKVISDKARPVTRKPVIYMAENPDDDPVIGDSEEVSAILGISPWYVRELCKSGKQTRSGWTVRKATLAEIKKEEVTYGATNNMRPVR